MHGGDELLIHANKPDWVVFNQSQSPAFQRLLEQLTSDFGSCMIYTGTPFPVQNDLTQVVTGPAYNRASLLGRAKTWTAYTISALYSAFRLQGRPFLFAVTNPPVLPLVAWLLSKLKGWPYALLMWDIYPDHMVQAGLLRNRGVVARTWTWLNRKAMRDATVVITIGERMAAVLRDQLGPDAERCRLEVIPNWGDIESLRPIAKADNDLAVEHDQVDKVTVLYSGNMGKTHGLISVVEAARRLQDDPRVSFFFIGDGLGKPELDEAVQRYQLTNVKLLPAQPWAVLPFSLAMADIAIVTQAPGSEHLSLPSKTYSMLATGAAILACTSEDSDLAALVTQHGVGVVCPQDSPEAIERAIRALVNDPQRLANCRATARAIAEEKFSFEAVHKQFRAALGAAVSGGTNQ